MSSEKIILPEFLIADLYKNHLVDLQTIAKVQENLLTDKPFLKTEKKTFPDKKIKYYGENAKNVVIAIQQQNDEYLPKEELSFLNSILKACGLTLTDIAIINLAGNAVNFTALKEQLGASYILLFGMEPNAINLLLQIPLFEFQQYDNCTILCAPTLSELNEETQNSRLLKTKLWTSLKKVFRIE